MAPSDLGDQDLLIRFQLKTHNHCPGCPGAGEHTQRLGNLLQIQCQLPTP